jgi:hypothetical protein
VITSSAVLIKKAMTAIRARQSQNLRLEGIHHRLSAMGHENRQIWAAMFNPVLSRCEIQWLVRGATNGGLADYLGSWQMALFEAEESPFDEVPTANREKQCQRKGEDEE